MNRELTREEVLSVLDGVNRVESSDLMLITPPAVTEPGLKKELNGVNGTMLNFEQFCYIMAELMCHQYRNSNRSWSNQLANKASHFARNLSIALTRLLGKFIKVLAQD